MPLQAGAQSPAAPRALEFFDRLNLNLTNPFPRNLEVASNLFQRTLAPIGEAEPHHQYFAFAARKVI